MCVAGQEGGTGGGACMKWVMVTCHGPTPLQPHAQSLPPSPPVIAPDLHPTSSRGAPCSLALHFARVVFLRHNSPCRRRAELLAPGEPVEALVLARDASFSTFKVGMAAAGCWLLAVGCWLLAAGAAALRSSKLLSHLAGLPLVPGSHPPLMPAIHARHSMPHTLP